MGPSWGYATHGHFAPHLFNTDKVFFSQKNGMLYRYNGSDRCLKMSARDRKSGRSVRFAAEKRLACGLVACLEGALSKKIALRRPILVLKIGGIHR